jgi:hypothetical protein
VAPPTQGPTASLSGHRRQPKLPMSLLQRKRRGPWRRKSPPPLVSRRGACRRVGQDPSAITRCGEYGGGARHPSPHGRSGARSGPDHRSDSGPYHGAHRREGYRPVADVLGGASGTEELEAEACHCAPLRVSCRSTKPSHARGFFFLTIVLFTAPSAEPACRPLQPPRR